MYRRRTHLDEIFQIDLRNQVSHPSQEIDITLNDKNNLLSEPGNNCHFIRSQSLGVDSLNTTTNSRGNVRRWSQSMIKGNKNGKKTIRERTINFMPSRLHAALILDGHTIISPDKEIEQLSKEIEQHDYLMQDNVTSERLRIETLRALPQSLATKRQIKAKITRCVENNSNANSLSQFQKIKYKIRMWLTKTITSIVNTFHNLELWYGSMKIIEGHFGSGVSTYFKFLRWLFVLDLFLLIVSFSFIVIPQILLNSVESKFDVARDMMSNRTNVHKNNTNEAFYFSNLFTGNGYLSDSIMFYGSYANATIGLSKLHTYNLPYAYFMTMICLYIFTFIVVSSSMARSYRKSFIETSGGFENMYAHHIFCAWDFGISNRKAAYLKHTSIFNELKELLNELYDSTDELSKLSRFWIASVQVSAHLLVFGMLAGLGLALWMALHVFINELTDHSMSSLYLPLTVNIVIIVFEAAFSWIAKLEDYKSDRLALHITLFRNYLLELVIMSVLLTYWLTNRFPGCWETFIGQEIYRLVIMDFLFFGIGNGLMHGIRFIIFKHFYPQIGLPEFNISRGSLGLIFNQMFLMVGLFFSPPLAVIVVVKMVLTFYIKKATLIYFCKPPSKLWRSAQTSTLFLVMTFLSVLGIIVSHGYMIARVEASKTCGPFTAYTFIFQIFIEGILALKKGHWFWRVVMFFTKPAFIGGILLTMSVIAYYLRAKSKARIAMVKLLKDMLYMEAKDKEFLLGNITRVTKDHEWIYDELANQYSTDVYAESSSTWNYKDGRFGHTSHSTSSDQSLNSINRDDYTPDSLRQRRY